MGPRSAPRIFRWRKDSRGFAPDFGLELRIDIRDDVYQLVDKALGSGGIRLHEPNDRGYLCGRSFQDLDRHNWDVFYVDETAPAA